MLTGLKFYQEWLCHAGNGIPCTCEIDVPFLFCSLTDKREPLLKTTWFLSCMQIRMSWCWLKLCLNKHKSVVDLLTIGRWFFCLSDALLFVCLWQEKLYFYFLVKWSPNWKVVKANLHKATVQANSKELEQAPRRRKERKAKENETKLAFI